MLHLIGFALAAWAVYWLATKILALVSALVYAFAMLVALLAWPAGMSAAAAGLWQLSLSIEGELGQGRESSTALYKLGKYAPIIFAAGYFLRAGPSWGLTGMQGAAFAIAFGAVHLFLIEFFERRRGIDGVELWTYVGVVTLIGFVCFMQRPGRYFTREPDSVTAVAAVTLYATYSMSCNVRVAPEANSRIVAHTEVGQDYTVIAQRDEWTQIKRGALRGWTACRSVAVQEPR